MRNAALALIGISAVALAGCNTQAKWTYPLDPSKLYRAPHSSGELTVAVLPFRESRPVTNRSATMWLYLIPGFPFGWVKYERPESARMFNTINEFEMELDEDFAKAAARSLDESQLFRRAYFTHGGETREADLLLQGTARHTTYRGVVITYGMSVYGPLLWFFGLPAGTSTNVMDVTLSLSDREGRELWSYEFSDKDGVVQGLYYNFGNDAVHFAELFAKAMNGALQNLAEDLPAIQAAIGRSPAVAAPPPNDPPGPMR